MTLTVKLKLDDDIRRVRLGSSDPYADHTPNYSDIVGLSKQLFGMSESNINLKYLDGSNHLVPIKSDLQLEDAIIAAAHRDRIPQFIVTGSAARAAATAPSSPLTTSINLPALSASAPTPAPFESQIPSVPYKYETTPKAAPPPTLIKRFHDLVKYLNIPDILHGLENFGYLTSDQSVELFECMLQLRSSFPELSRVLQYEEDERPFCTVKHVGVTCNSCFTTDICGTRYKCAICPDFDMCEKCERKGLLTHVPSDCSFVHVCKSHNAQGEKNSVDCPFSHLLKPPASPPITVATPTYEKRQLQFTTLLKKKQQRDTMRKMHIQEVERVRQQRLREEELKHEAEAKTREQEKQRKEQEKQRERELQQDSDTTQESDPDPSKSILWGYFENLKKQNRYQNITAVTPTNPLDEPSVIASALSPVTSEPSSNSNTPIAISGNLSASTFSAPASLANSTTSNSSLSLSPPLVHISSSSSASSLSSSPTPARSILSLNGPSSRAPLTREGSISSRLQIEKSFTPKSPESSPIFPRDALKRSIGSPRPRRASSLKHSTTIQKEDIEPESEVATKPKRSHSEAKSKKVVSDESSKSKRDLSGVLRDMGLRFSSDSDQSDDAVLSDSSSSDDSSRPKKLSNETSFFSSLRELLK